MIGLEDATTSPPTATASTPLKMMIMRIIVMINDK
jgi:hypothetical protein